MGDGRVEGHLDGCSSACRLGHYGPTLWRGQGGQRQSVKVTDDYLAAMESLWYDERPEHHGPFSDFSGIDAHPRPAQSRIPVVVGGRSEAAYRRAVRHGHGWYGFALTPGETAVHLAGLREAAGRVERPAELGELEISVTPRGRMTPELVSDFATLGVSRLVPMPRATNIGVAGATLTDVLATISSAADAARL